VALNQREAQRRGFLNQRGIQIGATGGGLGLGDGRLKGAKIADAGRAAAHLEEAAVQLDDLPQRDIPHQARRRYNGGRVLHPPQRRADDGQHPRPTRGGAHLPPGLRYRRHAARAIEHVQRAGGDPRTFFGKIYGQEKNLTTSSIARMNFVLHGIENFQIVREDTLRNPAFIDSSTDP
jgi:hypothetical protein